MKLEVEIVEFQRVPAGKDNMLATVGMFCFETKTGNKGVVTLTDDEKFTDKRVIEAIRKQVEEQQQWKGKKLTI